MRHGHLRGDVKIPTYKPHTNHKRSSVRSHTLTPTSICDLSHSVCWSPLTDLGHINSVTYVCHPLWFVCGHRKGILMSPLSDLGQGYFLNLTGDMGVKIVSDMRQSHFTLLTCDRAIFLATVTCDRAFFKIRHGISQPPHPEPLYKPCGQGTRLQNYHTITLSRGPPLKVLPTV